MGKGVVDVAAEGLGLGRGVDATRTHATPGKGPQPAGNCHFQGHYPMLHNTIYGQSLLLPNDIKHLAGAIASWHTTSIRIFGTVLAIGLGRAGPAPRRPGGLAKKPGLREKSGSPSPPTLFPIFGV